ncbi:MAG: ChrR family anti-sigma-E factor [Sphingomonadales bacterium]
MSLHRNDSRTAPAHHLNEEWLMAHAAGSLDEAYALVVACHLDQCAECRESLALAEALGGVFLENEAPTPVSAGSLDRIMACIDDPVDDGSPALLPDTASDLPRPLGQYIGQDIEGLKWRTIGPGVRGVKLAPKGRDDSRLWLLRAAPGTPLPDHGHRGSELTLILKGNYVWERGVFGPGDVDDTDDEVWHSPLVEAGEECICLVAMDGPLRLKGVFARLLQPVIGI